MVYPTKNEFKIGRSVESDMKIADISVSRVHSFIRFEGKELIIEDNGSKFGTMIRIDKPTKLLDTAFSKCPNKPMQNPFTLETQASVNSSIYQIGRTLFYFRFENFKTHSIPKKEVRKSGKPNSYARWKGTVLS
jgi:hypothetical protein